jgi:uncharacterized protein
MQLTIICSIYKSSCTDEMYLYVAKNRGLADVPATLLERFGKPGHVVDMLLGPDKRLARADSARVMQQVEQQGYYLQLPPKRETYLLDLHKTPVNPTY